MQRQLLDMSERRRNTVIFVTHDLDEAILLGDRVLATVLAPGQFAVGDPDSGRFVLIDEFYVSKPIEVLQSLRHWQDEGVLLSSVWVTFQTTFIGFAIEA